MSSILEAKRNIRKDLQSKRGENKIISKLSERSVDKIKVVKGIKNQKNDQLKIKKSI